MPEFNCPFAILWSSSSRSFLPVEVQARLAGTIEMEGFSLGLVLAA
jgi:hypothetical protein